MVRLESANGLIPSEDNRPSRHWSYAHSAAVDRLPLPMSRLTAGASTRAANRAVVDGTLQVRKFRQPALQCAR
jgi:hypothetical protein